MKKNEFTGKLVSVAIATYNGEKFIAEQIESILAQSHKDIELVVQDDQSTDRTVEIVKSFAQQADIRIEVNRQRLGFVRNFERAVGRARGDYIALCDQDDVWRADKIETLLREIGDADLIHGNCQLIDAHGNVLAPLWKRQERVRKTARELLFYNDVTGCTALFKRSLLKHSLPFPEGVAYHDWWFAICAATQHGLKYYDEPLISYRQHGGQDTGAFDGKSAGILFYLKKLRLFNSAGKRTVSAKQLKNLIAAKQRLRGILPDEAFDEAIAYHRSLSEGALHWTAFWIGMRRSRVLRPGDDMAHLKLVTNDLIG